MAAKRQHSVHSAPFAGLGVMLRFPDWPATRMIVWDGDNAHASARRLIARITGGREDEIELVMDGQSAGSDGRSISVRGPNPPDSRSSGHA